MTKKAVLFQRDSNPADGSPTAIPYGELNDSDHPSQPTAEYLHKFGPTGDEPFSVRTFTVDEAVEALGFGKFQIKLSCITGLAWMADAVEMMVLSILSPALHCEWGLSDWKQAWITTMVFLGMMLSSTFWGNVADKFGRKTELILSTALTFYFGLLSAASPTFIWLLLLRGLVGFGIGGVPQATTFYAEFLPKKYRAICINGLGAFWAIGTLFEVLLALVVMPTLGWRWLLGLSAFPLLLFLAGCFWIPESIRYHVASGQKHLAYATLVKISRENGRDLPEGRLVDTQEDDTNKRGQFLDLLSSDIRPTTFLLWFIWFANAFSYYGIVLLTTQIFQHGSKCHGGIVEENPNPACYLDCHQLTMKDYTDLLWTTLAEFPGLIITAAIIEVIGRRRTMAIEFMIFSLFVFLLFICTKRLTLTIFIFIARAFICGAFQAAYVYTPEVYPTTTRAIGLGTCSGFARLGAILTPFVAQVASTVSINIPVSIYGTICVIASIASIILPIETKGRELKDHSAPH